MFPRVRAMTANRPFYKQLGKGWGEGIKLLPLVQVPRAEQKDCTQQRDSTRKGACVCRSARAPWHTPCHGKGACVTMTLWAMPCRATQDGRSQWRVLTKRGPLEERTANHSSILAVRTPWTVWKGKKIRHWEMSPPGWKVSAMLLGKSREIAPERMTRLRHTWHTRDRVLGYIGKDFENVMWWDPQK